MALPKQIKDKVSLMALKDAAGDDFGMSDEPSGEGLPMKECACPECGHKGPQEEFELETEM